MASDNDQFRDAISTIANALKGASSFSDIEERFYNGHSHEGILAEAAYDGPSTDAVLSMYSGRQRIVSIRIPRYSGKTLIEAGGLEGGRSIRIEGPLPISSLADELERIANE
jgi:hypothetical protein